MHKIVRPSRSRAYVGQALNRGIGHRRPRPGIPARPTKRRANRSEQGTQLHKWWAQTTPRSATDSSQQSPMPIRKLSKENPNEWHLPKLKGSPINQLAIYRIGMILPYLENLPCKGRSLPSIKETYPPRSRGLKKQILLS